MMFDQLTDILKTKDAAVADVLATKGAVFASFLN
jgi:hypothetical protein